MVLFAVYMFNGHAYMYGKGEGKVEGGGRRGREGGGGKGEGGRGGNEEGGVRVCLLLLFVYDNLHLLVLHIYIFRITPVFIDL